MAGSSYSIALMNSLGLFAGTTISSDGSFLIVLNVFQSIKFLDDWILLIIILFFDAEDKAEDKL